MADCRKPEDSDENRNSASAVHKITKSPHFFNVPRPIKTQKLGWLPASECCPESSQCIDEFSNSKRIGGMAPITDSEDVQDQDHILLPDTFSIETIYKSLLACLAKSSLARIPCLLAYKLPQEEPKHPSCEYCQDDRSNSCDQILPRDPL